MSAAASSAAAAPLYMGTLLVLVTVNVEAPEAPAAAIAFLRMVHAAEPTTSPDIAVAVLMATRGGNLSETMQAAVDDHVGRSAAPVY